MTSTPMTSPVTPVESNSIYQATPVESAPVETSPSDVVPQVEGGNGAQNIPRSPIVDPNAFIIRGGKYAGSN